MTIENQNLDHKSLRALEHVAELAKDCVAFANARGGSILIGIEDGKDGPPPSQRVQDRSVDILRKRLPQQTINVGIDVRKVVAPNNGEFIELKVFPSLQTVAATSDGRYYMRVSDECHPLMPDELSRLLIEKSAFSWESHRARRTPVHLADEIKTRNYIDRIRDSSRVSEFVREKTDSEILDYYLLSQDGCLTNLGVLWIGRREQRQTLHYAPSLQCIKFDEMERKIDKWVWDDFSLNPMELIEAVWKTVPDWRQSYELPDGLYRTTIPHFDEVVVRELLANALVHRPYSQAGDIYLNLFPDRLEIHNPGLLPLGVTPANILHTSVKRNEHLAKVFYDLGLMEREGSGYDRIYEVLLSTGRPAPDVREEHDRVAVTVYKRIAAPAVLEFLGKADQIFALTQKEKIALGVLAQHESLTAIELCRVLELSSGGDLQPWLTRLLKWGLAKSRGRTKGVQYSVDPEVLRTLDFQGSTTLRGIEEHRLRELILQDLSIYRKSSSTEIQTRIGSEIHLGRIRKQLEQLVLENLLERTGERRWTRYHLKM